MGTLIVMISFAGGGESLMKKISVIMLSFVLVLSVAFFGCEKKAEAPKPAEQPAVAPPPAPAPAPAPAPVAPAPAPAPAKPAKK
jgi:pyruvate/2-oxoglutarate dehydrogenase complex dihydrolipoamide acyltransferase (E2) component